MNAATPAQATIAMPRLPGLLRGVALALLLGVAAASLWSIGRAALADLQWMRLRWQVGQWQSGQAPLPTGPAWGDARNALAAALALAPDDPQIHEALAYLYAIRAQAAARLPVLYASLMRQAQTSYHTAARLRPMSGASWVNVALATHLLNGPNIADATDTTLLWEAFDRAVQYGQREAYVQRAAAEIGFARWAQLTPARRSQLAAMVNGAWEKNREALQAIARTYGRQEVFSAL